MVGGQERIDSAAEDILAIGSDVQVSFGDLSQVQLNWRQAPGTWSVAQCLEHLITSQTPYVKLFDRFAEGDAATSAWERLSPLSGFFGRMLIRSADPASERKVKTLAKWQPPVADIAPQVVERFTHHQGQLAASLRRLPTDLDLERTVITSPLMPLITYNLDDALTMIVLHGRRHLRQAERVTATAAFPSGAP